MGLLPLRSGAFGIETGAMRIAGTQTIKNVNTVVMMRRTTMSIELPPGVKPVTLKYKIINWEHQSAAKIFAVPIIRETNAFLIVPVEKAKHNPEGEKKVKKQGSFHTYFDSWDDAHHALVKKAEARLERARRQLQEAQGFHGNVIGMKKGDVYERS
jgi:hypothetical protein